MVVVVVVVAANTFIAHSICQALFRGKSHRQHMIIHNIIFKNVQSGQT